MSINRNFSVDSHICTLYNKYAIISFTNKRRNLFCGVLIVYGFIYLLIFIIPTPSPIFIVLHTSLLLCSTLCLKITLL